MFKKTAIVIVLFFVCISVNASSFKDIKYKNLCNNFKVKVQDNSGWTSKTERRESDFYIIKGSEFYTKDGEFVYDSECSYIFIRKNSLIGYSNKLFKFYEILPENGNITKRELLPEEVSEIFENFKVIKLSDFSNTTNSYKFKKHKSGVNVLILNDKNYDMTNYKFSTNNSEFKNFVLNNAIEIKKSGMIQLSNDYEETELTPWFVLLVR